ncbi:MAG TPA: helix-turn-helix domain-containing protein [Thermomicrobiales bacterium]|nr:helix-turn-helix domain-containing protein [Thermomicrobiales bacterium]
MYATDEEAAMDDPHNRFPTWLTATMASRGLSQARLARAVGVTDAQVSRWRRGQVVPTVRSLQRIADTFGVPRATLDRLAGYPVGDSAGEAGDVADPAAQAEMEVYRAWFGQLLARKLPRSLWRVYADTCAALADALNASFEDALGKAQRELEATATAEPAGEGARPHRDVGFRRPGGAG